MKQYFGIDIGGTAVKLGIVDETGKVLCKGEQSVNFDGYQTPVLDTVRKAAKEFLTAQAIPVENLSGIGVSATGQIDSRKGIVAGTCGNFPNYIGSPIKAALEQDFGLPVTVANDANCMTLGEVWVGGAQGYTDVIGVTLGTGVGGGILTGDAVLGTIKSCYGSVELRKKVIVYLFLRVISRRELTIDKAFSRFKVRYITINISKMRH